MMDDWQNLSYSSQTILAAYWCIKEEHQCGGPIQSTEICFRNNLIDSNEHCQVKIWGIFSYFN